MRLLDLYAGTGSISLYLAHVRAPLADVLAVESVRAAAAPFAAGVRALAPLAQEGMPRMEVRTLAEGVDAQTLTQCDVIVVDPPRRGLDEATLRCLTSTPPRSRVIYVSCGFKVRAHGNPSHPVVSCALETLTHRSLAIAGTCARRASKGTARRLWAVGGTRWRSRAAIPSSLARIRSRRWPCSRYAARIPEGRGVCACPTRRRQITSLLRIYMYCTHLPSTRYCSRTRGVSPVRWRAPGRFARVRAGVQSDELGAAAGAPGPGHSHPCDSSWRALASPRPRAVGSTSRGVARCDAPQGGQRAATTQWITRHQSSSCGRSRIHVVAPMSPKVRLFVATASSVKIAIASAK